jgi:hypothetical protein
MHSITYVSAAVKILSQEALLNLLQRSRDNNAVFGISGLLLYKNGNFIQTIEGPEQHVRQLYNNICNDKSHHRMITIFDESIEERAFPQWSMGFLNLGQNEVPGYTDFLSEKADLTAFWERPYPAKQLLYSFRETIR